jgi:hypothetical protein
MFSLPLSSYGGTGWTPSAGLSGKGCESLPCLGRRKKQQNIINATVTIATTAATTPMAILPPVERPLEGFGADVVPGIAEGALESLILLKKR